MNFKESSQTQKSLSYFSFYVIKIRMNSWLKTKAHEDKFTMILKKIFDKKKYIILLSDYFEDLFYLIHSILYLILKLLNWRFFHSPYQKSWKFQDQKRMIISLYLYMIFQLLMILRYLSQIQYWEWKYSVSQQSYHLDQEFMRSK